MRFRIKFLFSLAAIILYLSQGLAFASGIDYKTEKDYFTKAVFTTENGLPQNTPSSLIQTRDGYIWIATFGGLARFDGLKFTVFTTNSYPAIANNRLTALYEDPNGVLWIGSETGDLANYKDGSFTLIRKSESEKTSDSIVSLYLDEKNILWVGAANGLKTLDLNTGEFTVFNEDAIFKKSSVSKEFRIQSFLKDHENNLWIASNGGLILYRDGKFTNLDESDGLPHNSITSIAINPEGGLWVLAKTAFGKYENGVFTNYQKMGAGGNTSPLALNLENHPFFTVERMLCEFNGEISKRYDLSSIISSDIHSMMFDNEGDLWVGTSEGLIQLKPRQIEVFSYKIKGSIFPTNAIIQDNYDTVWTTSVNNLIRWQHGKFDLVPLKNQAANPIAKSLAVDKDNVLWIGTYSGITKLKDGEFIDFDNSQLPESSVNALYFDTQGTLWIGSTGGLVEYKNGVYKTFTTKDGLLSNTISYITQDRNEVLWIGTLGGLSRFENGQFTNYKLGSGSPTNFVRDIYEDVDGTLWIGTYGNGIIRFRNGKFNSITSDNGLSENIASRILLDDRDYFWILGNQGIYTISRKSLNDFVDGATSRVFCTLFSKKDGIETSEGNGGQQPAGWKTKDGRLWFPMIQGAAIINPHNIKQSSSPVYIENVLSNRGQIDFRKNIELLPGNENLQISYTAINFSKPEQLQFRYKLDGFDTDWQYVGTRRTAFYSYLPPGNYKFIVTAATGDQWSEDEVVEIKVYAPYWQTWWFYLLIILSVIGLIIFIYQQRLENLKRLRLKQRDFSRQLMLAHESERQRIAAELHDGLGQSLLVIKNWALLGLKESKQQSKITKQLEEISETASQALDETRTIAHNLRPQQLQRFGLTETITNMITTISESSAIAFKTRVENIDKIFPEDAEINIYRIVQESLNNIVKHSEAKNALVEIARVSGKVQILISDDGKGFSKKSKIARNENADFGINSIIQRIELLGGKFSIISQPGKGTRINISLSEH